MLKKLMLINVKFQISILDFNFFHMDPPPRSNVTDLPGSAAPQRFSSLEAEEPRRPRQRIASNDQGLSKHVKVQSKAIQKTTIAQFTNKNLYFSIELKYTI